MTEPELALTLICESGRFLKAKAFGVHHGAFQANTQKGAMASIHFKGSPPPPPPPPPPPALPRRGTRACMYAFMGLIWTPITKARSNSDGSKLLKTYMIAHEQRPLFIRSSLQLLYPGGKESQSRDVQHSAVHQNRPASGRNIIELSRQSSTCMPTDNQACNVVYNTVAWRGRVSVADHALRPVPST